MSTLFQYRLVLVIRTATIGEAGLQAKDMRLTDLMNPAYGAARRGLMVHGNWMPELRNWVRHPRAPAG